MTFAAFMAVPVSQVPSPQCPQSLDIDSTAIADTGDVSTQCSKDYVTIPGNYLLAGHFSLAR